MIMMDFIIFLIGIAVLIASGSLMVKSISKIASFLHISEYVIGFIILAVATSIPELFVGVVSALEDNTALALGTVIGSNIANLTIIIGIPILLVRGINIKSEKTKKDALYMVALSVLPMLLMFLGSGISKADGLLLIAAFMVYVHKIYKERKVFKKEISERTSRWGIIIAVVIFLLSLLALFFSADLVVKYASFIAVDLEFPPIIIGLFLIAVGTSLPELVIGGSSAIKGHTELSIGNIIGSVIANSTLILGVTAMITPITSNFLIFITSGVYMILTIFIFATFTRSGDKLEWTEGISLILLYVFFIIMEFYIKGAV